MGDSKNPCRVGGSTERDILEAVQVGITRSSLGLAQSM